MLLLTAREDHPDGLIGNGKAKNATPAGCQSSSQLTPSCGRVPKSAMSGSLKTDATGSLLSRC
jgi:hypothetical protein